MNRLVFNSATLKFHWLIFHDLIKFTKKLEKNKYNLFIQMFWSFSRSYNSIWSGKIRFAHSFRLTSWLWLSLPTQLRYCCRGSNGFNGFGAHWTVSCSYFGNANKPTDRLRPPSYLNWCMNLWYYYY